MSKSILRSKTFWFNVLTIVAQYSGQLPIPAAYLPILVAVVNIALRYVTTNPVHVVSA